MTFDRRLTLDQAQDEAPALAERAREKGITDATWDVYVCEHCNCGCRRFIPLALADQVRR